MSCAALPCASQQRAETQRCFHILFSLCLKTKGNQGLKEKSRRLPENKSYINTEKRKKKVSVVKNTDVAVQISFCSTLAGSGRAMSSRETASPTSSRCSRSTACFLLYVVIIHYLAVHSLIPKSLRREPSGSFQNTYEMEIYLTNHIC